MPRLPLTALACLALASGGALVAGCGSDDSKDSGSSPAATTPAQTTSGDTGGTSPTKAAAIEMQSSKFVPETITVAVGQRIKWTNKDGYAHNVTSTAGEKIDSGNIDGGKTYEFAPKQAGTIAYMCTLHSNQNGKITVTK